MIPVPQFGSGAAIRVGGKGRMGRGYAVLSSLCGGTSLCVILLNQRAGCRTRTKQ